ncbi:MAG: Rnase Y domain-containing protein, partial [Nitrospinaceae bacterium]
MGIFTAVKFNFSTLLIGMFLAAVVGYLVGYFLRKVMSQYQVKEAESRKKKILEETEQEAQNKFKTAAMEAKEQALVEKIKVEKEVHEKWDELREHERKINQKEDNLRTKNERLLSLGKESDVKMEEAIKIKDAGLKEKAKYDELSQKEMLKLENISSYTAEQAKEEIKLKVTDSARLDAAKEVKKIEEHAKNSAEDQARQIITMAVQRLASDCVAESTVSVVALPDDSIKGRIIGREGRNIRAIEQATGVDLIIDDTPGAVVLSGFDPIRREVARQALEQLTLD